MELKWKFYRKMGLGEISVLVIFVFIFSMLVNFSFAQRVYAPQITGNGNIEVDEETLIFILAPNKIKEITPTENQLHILLTNTAKDYFYSLTSLNKGKKMVVKSETGETISEGLIRNAIDSGLIISKPVDSRIELAKFMTRIKQGRQPIILSDE